MPPAKGLSYDEESTIDELPLDGGTLKKNAARLEKGKTKRSAAVNEPFGVAGMWSPQNEALYPKWNDPALVDMRRNLWAGCERANKRKCAAEVLYKSRCVL